MRTKHTFRLPPDLAGKLADYAARKGAPQSLVVEAALASHLSPDGANRLEGVLARRLDRMTRQIERLERHVDISNEASVLMDSDAANKAIDADAALRKLGSDLVGKAYVTATITVWNEDARVADERLRWIEKTIQGRDFTCMRETVNAIEA
jgi:type IV secretion system protein VirB4